MSLHDAPMTLLNYFYIAACRCPNPQILSWPLILSTAACTVSLIWRLTVLYFSYKRMVCAKPIPPKKTLTGVAVNTPLRKHFQMAIDTSNASNGGRLLEFDETWPIRWARLRTLGPHPDVIVVDPETNGDVKSKPKSKAKPKVREKNSCGKWIRRFEKFRANFDIFSIIRNIIGYSCWFIVSILTYMSCSLVLWLPCLYHYTCRHNSFYHRHKLCRSFIKYFSVTFHYTIFYLSLLFSVVLIGLNLTLLSSVHGLGSNNLPPEVDRICVTVSPTSKTIYTNILPASAFEREIVLHKQLNQKYGENDTSIVTECKPLWTAGRLGVGFTRSNTGPWQMRTPINGHMLAVSTLITFNTTDRTNPSLRLDYTHSLYLRSEYKSDVRFTCTRNTEWKIIPSVAQLSWPYFSACQQNWKFNEKPELIKCGPIFRRKHV
ncbi:unnamed protein product [Caenorhabditis angaria]|uniref:Uncharacterized protein n=1 Tax=Caenorhabditis angaria TaxID=860376 RepID=A0A9P1J4A8_9PELO|nr:unnamed protein product [Caenorhabditis angaria]